MGARQMFTELPGRVTKGLSQTSASFVFLNPPPSFFLIKSGRQSVSQSFIHHLILIETLPPSPVREALRWLPQSGSPHLSFGPWLERRHPCLWPPLLTVQSPLHEAATPPSLELYSDHVAPLFTGLPLLLG